MSAACKDVLQKSCGAPGTVPTPPPARTALDRPHSGRYRRFPHPPAPFARRGNLEGPGMVGNRFVRWARVAVLAALAVCTGCCGFWERHCAPQQVAAPPCCCPCPPQSGYQPVPVAPVATTGFVPTAGPCVPCR